MTKNGILTSETLFMSEHVSDPFPLYDQWRDASPVRTADDLWLVLGYDDVMQVLSDHRTFSSDLRHMKNPVLGQTPIIFEDPPSHTRHRRLVQSAFTPSRIRSMIPWVEKAVAALVDGLPVGDSEVISSLCDPLPVQVIAHLLGVPESVHSQFKTWSDERTYLVGVRDQEHKPETIERIKVATAANQALLDYFLQQARRRRSEPMGDLISEIVRDGLDGPSDEQVAAICALVLTAGNVTTTNLLGNLLALFADNPTTYQQVRADPSLIDSAVEEALRLESPVQWLYRISMADTTLGGARIPAGSRLLVYFGAANRDPRIFEQPAEFRLDRPPQRHMGFGHGIHFCLGAPLARAEANAVVSAIVRRFRAIEPGSTRERIRDASTHCGYERLEIRLID